MARRTRGRKPRVVWLPVHGNASVLGEYDNTTATIGASASIAFTPDGSIYYDAQGVTFDDTRSASAVQGFGASETSLADLVGGQGYRLRRIVGKIFIAKSKYYGTSNSTPALDVAAGFIVCRTDSAGTPTTDFVTTNPLAQDSAEDPWIWRRRWILGDPGYGTTSSDASALSQFPSTNAHYGSVLDGPHIDAKTARVIGPDEKLMFILAYRNPAPVEPVNGVAFNYVLDLRILASMRSSQGNRRNASR